MLSATSGANPGKSRSMDDQTLSYYDTFAGEIAESYDRVKGGIGQFFPLAFSPGMRVLDVGAGSGRDIRNLLDMGVDAYGVEPSTRLRACALERHPVLVGRLERGDLPKLGKPFGGQFDGISCSAVLMHLPREEMFDAAVALRDALKDDGRLLISIPADRPDIDKHHRDDRGRLFTPLNEEYLGLLFERLGFQQVGKWHSSDATGRKGHSWCTLLFYLRHAQTARPLDEIAGILSRDRKVATYKLRAISGSGRSGDHRVRAGSMGRSRDSSTSDRHCIREVAFRSLATCGILPVHSSDKRRDRSLSETDCVSEPLSELIHYYSRAGGLVRFVLDWRGERLAYQPQALLQTTLRKIGGTIGERPGYLCGWFAGNRPDL